MDLAEFSTRTENLIDRLSNRVPERELRQYREYARVGEWTELIDDLAAVLVNQSIPVSPAERDEFDSLLKSYDLPIDCHEYINKRAKVVESLNVVADQR